MNKLWLTVLCLALAGCASKSPLAPVSLVTPPSPPAISAEVQPEKSANSENQATPRLATEATCVNELAALKSYSPKSWNKYSIAMADLNRKNSKFISVRDALNPQLNELVLNAYDSRMKTLCYRIESTLGQAMVSQVNPL